MSLNISLLSFAHTSLENSDGISAELLQMLKDDAVKVLHSRGPGTLIPSAQRLVWAAKQPLGKAALGALFA